MVYSSLNATRETAAVVLRCTQGREAAQTERKNVIGPEWTNESRRYIEFFDAPKLSL